MNFGDAITALKLGHYVSREGWNGKGMYLFLVSDWYYLSAVDNGYPKEPFIAMKTADNKVVPWLASQTDVLSDDWGIVNA